MAAANDTVRLWSYNAPVDAGTYLIRAILSGSQDNHFADFATPSKEYTITRQAVAKPTAVTGLTWKGQKLVGVNYNKSTLAYTLTAGVTSAIDVGTYTATFTLDKNFMWLESGDTQPLVITFTIGRAIGQAEVLIIDYILGSPPAGFPSVKADNKVGDWQTISFIYSADSGFASWSTTAPGTIGTFFVRAVLIGSLSGNYADFTTEYKQFNVLRIPV